MKDGDAVIVQETLDDGTQVEIHMVETWDGLYAPIALRRPDGEGPFAFVVLASGNGGGGVDWLRSAVRERRHIMDRLVDAGYACAWTRYRTEVELGYNNGGELVRDMRQGRGLFNRSPLEYEDEIAIIEYVKGLEDADPDRLAMIGMSHGGEMVMKITSEYHGLAAAVASEPASHEYLALSPDDTAHVNPDTGLRDIESMMMVEVDKVRGRIDEDLARKRVAGIETPILVMGRVDDELQGVFRTTFDMLAEAGKDAEWVDWDHSLHGYIYPITRPDGTLELDEVQTSAIDGIIEFLDRHLR